MQRSYECADCGRAFPVTISDAETAGSLDEHAEACPACERRVGWGLVDCRVCGEKSLARLPHWHVRCNVANAACPACGNEIRALCIC
jgi:DNA-directed RNA polymerase subunit RPC12/RpoP